MAPTRCLLSAHASYVPASTRSVCMSPPHLGEIVEIRCSDRDGRRRRAPNSLARARAGMVPGASWCTGRPAPAPAAVVVAAAAAEVVMAALVAEAPAPAVVLARGGHGATGRSLMPASGTRRSHPPCPRALDFHPHPRPRRPHRRRRRCSRHRRRPRHTSSNPRSRHSGRRNRRRRRRRLPATQVPTPAVAPWARTRAPPRVRAGAAGAGSQWARSGRAISPTSTSTRACVKKRPSAPVAPPRAHSTRVWTSLPPSMPPHGI